MVWWATTKILIGILREVSLNCTALRAVEWFGWITRDLPEARLLAKFLVAAHVWKVLSYCKSSLYVWFLQWALVGYIWSFCAS